jgi:ABC-2 type transport system permease protein
MIKKYILVTWMMIKNSYIRDSKISGYIVSKCATQIVEIFVNVIFFNIIFANTKELAGWSYYQVLFLYFFSRSIILLDNAIFKKGINTFAKTMVRKGDYDFFLIKPINPMYLTSISSPQIYYAISAIFYISLAVYALLQSGVVIHLASVLWFIFLSFFGLALYYFLNIICVIPTFWFIRLYTLKDIIHRFNGFMRYPIGILPFSLRFVLTVLFPIVIISNIPAATVFYPPNMLYIVYMITLTIVFGLIASAFWRFGQQRYSSASS